MVSKCLLEDSNSLVISRSWISSIPIIFPGKSGVIPRSDWPGAIQWLFQNQRAKWPSRRLKSSAITPSFFFSA